MLDISEYQEPRMPEPKPVYTVPPEYGGRTARPRAVPESLMCLGCGKPLVPLIESDGRLAIRLHRPEGEMLIQTARITCGACGTTRAFFGAPLSGFRLGIVDEAGG